MSVYLTYTCVMLQKWCQLWLWSTSDELLSSLFSLINVYNVKGIASQFKLQDYAYIIHFIGMQFSFEPAKFMCYKDYECVLIITKLSQFEFIKYGGLMNKLFLLSLRLEQLHAYMCLVESTRIEPYISDMIVVALIYVWLERFNASNIVFIFCYFG